MKSYYKIPCAILVTACIAIGAGGCKKYEEGPMFSLRSKKERVANTWKIEQAIEDGRDITSSYDQYEVQLYSNGTARLVAVYTLNNVTFEYETDGTWDFENKNEDIKLDMEDDSADRTYRILRLKEEEFWVLEKGDDVELHLIPME